MVFGQLDWLLISGYSCTIHLQTKTKWLPVPVTDVLYHFCGMNLITAWATNFLQFKVSCCLHMYFLWRHHLPPDKSENDQDNKSLLLCFSFTQLYCFVFHLPNLLLTQNFVYPTLFSSVPPLAINNTTGPLIKDNA